jgi:translation initiation factor IF-3
LRENRGRRQVDERKVVNVRQLPEEVRVVQTANDEDTNSVMAGSEAWNLSLSTGLDLVLITKDAKPPVYRLCDYGKFKFAEDKHQRELERSNRMHTRTIKTIRINQNIGPADYDRDLARIREWLPKHDVRLEVIMRGFKGQGNRRSLPRGLDQAHAYQWNEFILNRVLRDLGSEVRADRMSAGDKGISTTVRPV